MQIRAVVAFVPVATIGYVPRYLLHALSGLESRSNGSIRHHLLPTSIFTTTPHAIIIQQ
jgi:hypothetical protein